MALSSNLALFDRRVKLTIANPVATAGNFKNVEAFDVIEIDGGKTSQADVPGMRVKFKIEKSDKKEPNTSEVIVTNLSPSRQASLQKVGVKLLLEAGYKETGTSRIFSGDVRTIDHVRNNADWDSTMKLGDGERAWRFARVNESFAAGSLVSDVLKKLVAAMGIEPGNVETQAALLTARLEQGFLVAGSAARSLDQLVTSLRKTWSVQDGKMQILDPYEAINSDGDIPEISPSTGLIGSPEMGTPPSKGKPALLKFKSFLIPVKPRNKVRLKSRRYDGFILIHKVTYTGDTHGGEWQTEMEGTIIK